MSGTCSTHGKDEKFINNILVGKPEGKRSPRDNIRMDVREIGWEV
jgi:hypothetical protein